MTYSCYKLEVKGTALNVKFLYLQQWFDAPARARTHMRACVRARAHTHTHTHTHIRCFSTISGCVLPVGFS
jgi:hypothetical protein